MRITGYVDEVGSDWLRRALFASTRAIVVVSTQLLVVEIISALNRRVREGTVTRHDCKRLSGRFRDDCLDSYHLIAPDDVIVDLACALLERHPLRAYATALSVNRWLVGEGEQALTFLSSDDRLNEAAAAEGLTVDNPNDHP